MSALLRSCVSEISGCVRYHLPPCVAPTTIPRIVGADSDGGSSHAPRFAECHIPPSPPSTCIHRATGNHSPRNVHGHHSCKRASKYSPAPTLLSPLSCNCPAANVTESRLPRSHDSLPDTQHPSLAPDTPCTPPLAPHATSTSLHATRPRPRACRSKPLAPSLAPLEAFNWRPRGRPHSPIPSN
jgi:hypothetical protein